jgi:hypothetical protein
VIERIGTDARCSSHQMVQAVRKGKEGWFHVYCPSSLVCTDDGQTWGHMVRILGHLISLIVKQLEIRNKLFVFVWLVFFKLYAEKLSIFE